MCSVPATGKTITDVTDAVLAAHHGRIDVLFVAIGVQVWGGFDLEKDVTSEQVNAALREASHRLPLQGILRVTDEALVSQDIFGDPHSSIVDALSTMVLNNRIVKILSWYDNEWGYSARLVDFAGFMAGKGLFTKKERSVGYRNSIRFRRLVKKDCDGFGGVRRTHPAADRRDTAA